MNRRKLLQSVSGGALALWTGSLLKGEAWSQAAAASTSTSTTTPSTDPNS